MDIVRCNICEGYHFSGHCPYSHSSAHSRYSYTSRQSVPDRSIDPYAYYFWEPPQDEPQCPTSRIDENWKIIHELQQQMSVDRWNTAHEEPILDDAFKARWGDKPRVVEPKEPSLRDTMSRQMDMMSELDDVMMKQNEMLARLLRADEEERERLRIREFEIRENARTLEALQEKVNELQAIYLQESSSSSIHQIVYYDDDEFCSTTWNRHDPLIEEDVVKSEEPTLDDEIEAEKEQELLAEKMVIDFTWSDEEIDARVAEYRDRLSELFPILPEPTKDPVMVETDKEIIPGTETIMDVEVPPPVLCLSDLEEDEWDAFQRYLENKAEDAADVGEPACYVSGDDSDDDDAMSWEYEFKEEIEELGMPPVTAETDDFDPEGDLAILEALIKGDPVNICGEDVVESCKLEPCLESPEVADDPVISAPPLDFEKPIRDPYSIPIQVTLRFNTQADRHSRLGWADHNSYLCAHLVFVIFVFFPGVNRRIVRSVDGKRIKEKPPD